MVITFTNTVKYFLPQSQAEGQHANLGVEAQRKLHLGRQMLKALPKCLWDSDLEEVEKPQHWKNREVPGITSPMNFETIVKYFLERGVRDGHSAIVAPTATGKSCIVEFDEALSQKKEPFTVSAEGGWILDIMDLESGELRCPDRNLIKDEDGNPIILQKSHDDDELITKVEERYIVGQGVGLERWDHREEYCPKEMAQILYKVMKEVEHGDVYARIPVSGKWTIDGTTIIGVEVEEIDGKFFIPNVKIPKKSRIILDAFQPELLLELLKLEEDDKLEMQKRNTLAEWQPLFETILIPENFDTNSTGLSRLLKRIGREPNTNLFEQAIVLALSQQHLKKGYKNLEQFLRRTNTPNTHVIQVQDTTNPEILTNSLSQIPSIEVSNKSKLSGIRNVIYSNEIFSLALVQNSETVSMRVSITQTAVVIDIPMSKYLKDLIPNVTIDQTRKVLGYLLESIAYPYKKTPDEILPTILGFIPELDITKYVQRRTPQETKARMDQILNTVKDLQKVIEP